MVNEFQLQRILDNMRAELENLGYDSRTAISQLKNEISRLNERIDYVKEELESVREQIP